MSLAELAVENLRAVEKAELAFDPAHNLIWGPNGSGKTSLLEAIFLLGRGRSFRTRNSERLIRHGQDHLVVFGRTASSPPQSLGVQVSRKDGTLAKIGGSFIRSLAELSQSFPVQIIDPGVHKLVEEGAHRRRRWMDWAVFHVEPGFIDVWTRYTRTLKQRNAALRHDPSQATAWNHELAQLGTLLADSRKSFVEQLQPYWERTVQALTGLPIVMHYSRGWSQDHTLAQMLHTGLERDRLRGMTHAGPHRSDVTLRLDGRPARDVLSRGQQKLVAIALILAQLAYLQEVTDTVPTLLLDDPAAELDEERLDRFIAQVSALKCQLIFTSLHADSSLFGSASRVFHVEQGRVKTL